MSLVLDWACRVANTIQHIREPSRLILTWQASEKRGNRKRLAVGELTQRDGTVELTYYDKSIVAEAVALGYEGYAAFNLKESFHSRDVLQAFMRRLPPRSRNDFSQYLAGLRLPVGAHISDFALLGYSEAKLPSDGFSLVDPLDSSRPPSEYLWEVAGYRHYGGLGEADIGREVFLEAEPSNAHDPDAVAIRTPNRILGYINRIQAPVVKRWIVDGRTSANIEKLNGTSNWPRAYIFVRFN